MGQIGVPITPPIKAAIIFTRKAFASPMDNNGPKPNVGNQLGIKPSARPQATC